MRCSRWNDAHAARTQCCGWAMGHFDCVCALKQLHSIHWACAHTTTAAEIIFIAIEDTDKWLASPLTQTNDYIDGVGVKERSFGKLNRLNVAQVRVTLCLTPLHLHSFIVGSRMQPRKCYGISMGFPQKPHRIEFTWLSKQKEIDAGPRTDE